MFRENEEPLSARISIVIVLVKCRPSYFPHLSSTAPSAFHFGEKINAAEPANRNKAIYECISMGKRQIERASRGKRQQGDRYENQLCCSESFEHFEASAFLS